MLKRIHTNTDGHAMVEFGIILPVMTLMLLGAADFGRLFVESAIVADASKSGAVRGYLNTQSSMDSTAIQAAVNADASGLKNVTASSETYCDCPNNPGVRVVCATTTCSGYGPPRVYVKARASYDFKTIVKYFGLRDTVSMNMDTYLRVQ